MNPTGQERKGRCPVDQRRRIVWFEGELRPSEAPHPVEQEDADEYSLVGRYLPGSETPLGRLAAAADHERRLDEGIEREPRLVQGEFDAAGHTGESKSPST